MGQTVDFVLKVGGLVFVISYCYLCIYEISVAIKPMNLPRVELLSWGH